ncbi:PP2C family serine/threonine-protein phosphatase [Paraburkholderia silviterrae]|uniref:Protein phosphatase 2C domain-containing protein n=1 Tax=Paraburkholderia silviterrae TaxID=2528715 RepID=A0A4R5M5C4_9BURK|nr:PP2C family serine/threonine-protein phosphatase [Paraburkholderia silviterrae]TDG21153.1 protein phosphatase 2C domain-containing protein [Paraburkholderia silviterrae]
MSWSVIGSSVAGSSHSHSSDPCQDSCFYYVTADATGASYLIALAADGAGSAKFGEVGSELACETGGETLLAAVEESGERAFSLSLASSVLHAVRAKIERAASAREVSARELACTLLGAVVGPTQAMYFQIGDGAIVVRHDDDLSPVFWPESGEYANMTYFVTDASAAEHLRYETRGATDEIALFTDGLQRLALVFATETAHAPFFDPMFKMLRASSDEQTDELCAALKRFLGSDAINERTDDDKTLILATRRSGAGSVVGV